MIARAKKRSLREQAMSGIVHHAKECERALSCADFAESEPALGTAVGSSFRKLAAYHSENAFSWARHLTGGACT